VLTCKQTAKFHSIATTVEDTIEEDNVVNVLSDKFLGLDIHNPAPSDRLATLNRLESERDNEYFIHIHIMGLRWRAENVDTANPTTCRSGFMLSCPPKAVNEAHRKGLQ
jgi:hypothetical protein